MSFEPGSGKSPNVKLFRNAGIVEKTKQKVLIKQRDNTCFVSVRGEVNFFVAERDVNRDEAASGQLWLKIGHNPAKDSGKENGLRRMAPGEILY